MASPKYVISAQSRRFMSTLTLDEKFKITQDRSGEVFPDASNQEKLKVYSLFKQATEGKNTKKKPSAMDFEGSAKWKAWNKLGDLPQVSFRCCVVSTPVKIFADELMGVMVILSVFKEKFQSRLL